jgi:hypothetical protein
MFRRSVLPPFSGLKYKPSNKPTEMIMEICTSEKSGSVPVTRYYNTEDLTLFIQYCENPKASVPYIVSVFISLKPVAART